MPGVSFLAESNATFGLGHCVSRWEEIVTGPGTVVCTPPGVGHQSSTRVDAYEAVLNVAHQVPNGT